MNIALLGAPDSWYIKDLTRAAAGRHAVARVPFTRMQSIIEKGSGLISEVGVTSGEVGLDSYDAVLVRTMPPGTLEQVVFRMNALAQVEAAGCVVLNPPRALEIAVDKYLCLARLAGAGLPVPPTVVCQDADDAMAAFAKLGGDVVVKPLFGSEGRGLMRVDDEGLALRTFKTLAQLGAVIYLQTFVPHPGHDLRVLLLGEKAWCIRRTNPTDWRTNIARGAKAEPFELTPQLEDLARAAADAVGAPFAGVDILPGLDGELYLLEVNAVPGWRGLATTLNVDIAAEVLAFLPTS